MEFLGSMAKDFIFFSGDVQTTTIAVAITGSLCCSIMAAIIQLVLWLNAHPSKLQKQYGTDAAHCNETESCNSVSSSVVGKQYEGNKSNFQKLKQLLQRDFHSCMCQRHKSEGVESSDSTSLKPFDQGSDINTICSTATPGIPGSTVPNVNNHSTTESLQTTEIALDLSFQNIRQCPSRLGYSGSHLSSLNLSNNHLTTLPEEIGCLTGLKELHLMHNSLTTLPSSLVSLKRLLELDVRKNWFKTLPECVCSLSSLEYLNVSCNYMANLPPEIGTLKSLRSLFAGFNVLENIPKELCLLKDLEVLDCSYNNINCLPEAMGDLVRLSKLDLTSCHLRSLPASLTRCASLTSLKLGNNRLSSLPVQIGRIHSLRELEVHSNQISVYPASLSGLPLEELKVLGNTCNSESGWKELSVVPSSEFPPLLEITARYIVQHKLSWKRIRLPKRLQEFLESSVECSTCEGPCFEFYSSKVTLSPVGRHQQWLPLLDRCCCPHSFTGCKFRT